MVHGENLLSTGGPGNTKFPKLALAQALDARSDGVSAASSAADPSAPSATVAQGAKEVIVDMSE